MTDNEMRIAIAEACGWKQREVAHGVLVHWHSKEWFPPKSREWGSLPDYLNDLNAMHEAEELMIRSLNQDAKYVCALTEIASSQTNIYTKERAAISATARQRAIAFLKTIGKYKE